MERTMGASPEEQQQEEEEQDKDDTGATTTTTASDPTQLRSAFRKPGPDPSFVETLKRAKRELKSSEEQQDIKNGSLGRNSF